MKSRIEVEINLALDLASDCEFLECSEKVVVFCTKGKNKLAVIKFPGKTKKIESCLKKRERDFCTRLSVKNGCILIQKWNTILKIKLER